MKIHKNDISKKNLLKKVKVVAKALKFLALITKENLSLSYCHLFACIG